MTELWNIVGAHSWLITGIGLTGALFFGIVKGKRERAAQWDALEAGRGEFPADASDRQFPGDDR